MKLLFYLKGEQIYGVCHIRGERIRFFTGEYVPAQYWDAEKHRAKVTKRWQQHESLNYFLDSLEAACGDSIRTHKLSQTLSAEAVKTDLLRYLGRIPDDNPTLVELFDQYIKEHPGKEVYTHIKKTIPSSVKSVTDYSEFFSRYREDRYAEGYNMNTVFEYMSKIRTVLRFGYSKHLPIDMEMVRIASKAHKSAPDTVYLDETEIEQLAGVECNNEIERDVLRAFIFGCRTGLRVSDIKLVRKENVKDGILRILTKKTGEEVLIPIGSATELIGVKLHNKGTSNLVIKRLAERAGIVAEVDARRTQGGEKKVISYNKFQLLGMHTARRSFATNAYLAGVPPLKIMHITGHRTESSFMRYIRVSKLQTATSLKDHPFFR